MSLLTAATCLFVAFGITSPSCGEAFIKGLAFKSQNHPSQSLLYNQRPEQASSMLSLDEITQEWTAKVQSQTDLTEQGVQLGAASSKELQVDTIRVSFPRKPDQGLGLELLEIAGGRGDDDMVGITIVSGLVEGGCAFDCDILPDDSISKVAIWQQEGNEQQEIASVSIECLNYDATVNAILSLPPPAALEQQELYVLTIKRLRRKPRIRLTIQYPPSQKKSNDVMDVFCSENLRLAVLKQGIQLTDSFAREYYQDRGSGSCGAEGFCCECAISITRGANLLNPQGTTEEQWLAENPRWRLACKAIALKEGEMVIRANPEEW